MTEKLKKLESTPNEPTIIDKDAKLIKQGAEAKIYKVTFNEKEAILKQRLSKLYRHPKLDKKLTKSRLVKESKCSQGIQSQRRF